MRKVLLPVVLALLAGSAVSARAQDFSVRTNALYWASGTPNAGAEVALGDHWSAGVNLGFKPWPRFWTGDTDRPLTLEEALLLSGATSVAGLPAGNAGETLVPGDAARWKHLVVAPELRYYLNQVFDGAFVAADLVYTHYNTGAVTFPLGLYPDVRNNRLQGYFAGVGLSWGYSWWLGRHLRLEAEAGLAAGWTTFDRFECAVCGDRLAEDETRMALVPKLALNLAVQPRGREEALPLHPLMDTLVLGEAPVVPPLPVLEAVLPSAVPDNAVDRLDTPLLRDIDDYLPYTPERVMRKEKGALRVYFELDSIRLKRSFREGTYVRDNGAALDSVIDVTKLILDDPKSEVRKIQLIGFASIEGPVRRNVWLGDQRGKALRRYVQDTFRERFSQTLPDSLFITENGAEGWADFADQIHDLLLAQERGEPTGFSAQQLQKVDDIIKNPTLSPTQKEALFKKDRALYKILKEKVLHDQRNSGYIHIYVSWIPDTAAAAINTAIRLLSDGDAAGALARLTLVRDDPRAANAYGLALFHAGEETRGMEVLAAAAEQGDAEAAENRARLQHFLQQRTAWEAASAARAAWEEAREENRRIRDENALAEAYNAALTADPRHRRTRKTTP